PILIPESRSDRLVRGNEFAFAVRHRKLQRFIESFRPDALSAGGFQRNPAVDESARVVVGERAGLAASSRDGAGQKVSLDQHLKAVADSDDRLARVDEVANRVAQVMHDLVGEDATCGDVVAVTESAGDGENLKLFHRA